MTFLWPDALWLLLFLPAAVAAYVLVLRFRKRAAVHYPDLAVIKRQENELSALFAGLAAMLAIGAAALSLAWFAR